MSYRDHIKQDRRLSILMLLQESDGYEANEYVLQLGLSSVHAHNVSIDRLRTDIDWLAEQSLVTVRSVGETRLAKLTARGADVAGGRAVVSGVKRPQPGEV